MDVQLDVQCQAEVGWCLTAISAQKSYIVPCEKKKFVKDINFR